MEWLDRHKNKDRILFLQHEREYVVNKFAAGLIDRESSRAIVASITERIKELACDSTFRFDNAAQQVVNEKKTRRPVRVAFNKKIFKGRCCHYA